MDPNHFAEPLVLLLFAPGLVTVYMAVYAWRRRPLPTAESFAAVMACAGVWSLGYACELLSEHLAAQMWWVRVEYLGIAALPVAWLVFALQYSGHGMWVTPRRVAALLIMPAIAVLMVWTDTWHHLYYGAITLQRTEPLTTWSATRGPWYGVHVVYSYALVLIGIVYLLRTLLQFQRRFHSQALVVLAAVLAPWATNLAYLMGVSPVPGLDLTPYAFTVTGLAIGWGLFRLRLLDLAPMARDAVFEAISEAVLVVDEQGRVVDLNVAAEQVLSQSAALLLGQPIAPCLPCWAELLERTPDSTRPWPRLAMGKPEASRYYEPRLFPLHRVGASVGAHLVLMTDVTERERAQQALRDSELTYRDLFNTVAEAIYIQDRQGRFLDVNRGAELMYGYRREVLIGLTPEPLAAPGLNDLAATVDALDRAFAGEPQQFEFWGRRASGEVFPKDVRLYKGTYLGQEVVIALARDVTGRKRGEQRVSEALQRFEALFDGAPLVAIQGVDRHGCVQHWNKASEALYGYAAAQMMGKSLSGLLSAPEDVRVLEDDLSRLWSGEVPSLRREWEVVTRNGGARLVDSVMFPVREEGKVVEVFCMDVDITDRKRIEDAQRLAAVGQLAAGVAHEFNNLMAAMLLQAEMTNPENLRDARDLKSVVLRSARRGGATCADLMAFARPPELHREPVLIQTPIERALAVAHRQLDNAQIVVEHQAPGEDLYVYADPGQLEQVMLNLILNATHAMSSEVVPLDNRCLTIAVEGAAQGQEVLVEVTDTGIGIPPEHLPRVFEPFFTSKARVDEGDPEGTGLGLSVSHGIVTAHGGRMSVTSEPGAGTTFAVALPVMTPQEVAQHTAQSVATPGLLPLQTPARILLAEDEPDVRNVLVAALTELGHTVTAAATTDEALSALEHEGPFDALVTDLMMPGEGGAAVLTRARDLSPALATVVITGKLDLQLRQQMAALGADAVVPKPFSLAQLLEALGKVLAGRAREEAGDSPDDGEPR